MAEPKPKLRTFRSTFFTGLFIALPVLVTLWVVGLVFGSVDSAVTPAVLKLLQLVGLGTWSEEAWVKYIAPLFSITLSVFLIWLLGLVGGNVFGRQLLGWVETLVLQVPVVRGIYSATRQFIDTFSQSQGQAFSRVVLAEYPRKGTWVPGFITSEASGQIARGTGTGVVSVFIPTTPNPTSGFLIYLPESECIPLTMSVDDAFKMIVSCGVLMPPEPQAPTTPASPTGTPTR